MNPRIDQSLRDIVDHCDELMSYTDDLILETFRLNRPVRRQVERLLLIIGEAVARIRDADKAKEAKIESAPQIIGMRNRLAHDYDTINPDILWLAATKHVPILRERALELLADNKE